MGKKGDLGIAILGGTGYGAGELLRLIAAHPLAAAVSIVSSSTAGGKVADSHPQLRAINNLCFDGELNLDALSECEHGIIFSALPHATSAETIEKLLPEIEKRRLKVIDLSPDYRLRDPQAHDKFYPDSKTSPQLRAQFVYGLTELNREAIAGASFVANPGCLASAAALALAPIAKCELPAFKLRSPLVIDAKTGTSGAGLSLGANFHHAYRHASATAYKVLTHRHEPEIKEAAWGALESAPETFFVPHLLPISRGIFTTVYLTLESEVSPAAVKDLYSSFYAESPFIRLLADPPELGAVVCSNYCDIAFQVRGKQLVVMAALDNLVKGMAGVAIQNMNLICGLPEHTGLSFAAPGLI
jgi:N-acetyl-gamma-glutamyl-phosphate reductase common form